MVPVLAGQIQQPADNPPDDGAQPTAAAG